MKILHMALSCFYVEGYNYQENILPRINKRHGHEVKIVASRESFVNNFEHGYTNAGVFINEDEIEVRRLKYKLPLPKFLNRKIRIYRGTKKELEQYRPDIVVFHGLAAGDLYTVARYCKRNNVTLYVDSHEDQNNSASNFLSKYILHRLYYKFIIKKSIKSISKVLSITHETTKFIIDNYNIPIEMIQDFPLGGEIIDIKEKRENRNEVLNSLKMRRDDILLFHSGKLDKNKKTFDLLDAFKSINDNRFYLAIAGKFSDESYEFYKNMYSNNKHIIYLGWLSTDDLRKYISAADLYFQPGSQSATMQLSLCCGTPVAVWPHESHKYLLGNLMPYIENKKDIVELIESLSKENTLLQELVNNAFNIASTKLDYEKLAYIIEK